MNPDERRKKIILLLKKSTTPVSASMLACQFQVSRQVIVGDIALLRAKGHPIKATPRGYLLATHNIYPYVGTIVCKHSGQKMEEELLTIVDNGGTVIDVRIEHPIYGQLTGELELSSRYDISLFLKKMTSIASPLSLLSDGIHLHYIGCKDEETFLRIKAKLKDKGILYHEGLTT